MREGDEGCLKESPPSFFFFSDFDLQYCPWSCPLALVARTTCYRDVLKMMQSVGTAEMVAWKCFFITDQSAYAIKTCIHSDIIFFSSHGFSFFPKGFFFQHSDLFVRTYSVYVIPILLHSPLLFVCSSLFIKTQFQ